MSELRSGRLFAKMPGLLILIAVINAILPQVLFPDLSYLKVILSIAPLVIVGAFLLPRKQFFLLVLAVFAGIGSLTVHRKINSASYTALLGNNDRNALVLAKVVDPSCCGSEVAWLPNPALIKVEILEISFNGDLKPHKSQGLAAVRLPADAPLLKYGDIVRLKGTFRNPESHFMFQKNMVPGDIFQPVQVKEAIVLPVPGTKHFQDYLKSRNISRIFYCEKFIRNESAKSGFLGPVLALRNFLLLTVSEGIEDENNRDLIATLLFGCRQGLDYADKANYVKSGTIHIFTVSGLHVGILAFILFWVFRWVPFRKRHLLVPALVFLYVLSTGMHPPALRAWLMIAVWCICRAYLFYIPALNIVFLTAALLMLKNPFYIKDMGFQFSFTVVGFLILSTRGTREWEGLFRELFAWIPTGNLGRFRYWRGKWRRRFILALLGCVIAWLASSGISLYYQGIYFPFSIVANLLLIPFVLLLFNLVFVKIFLSFCSFLVPVTAWLVENLCDLIDSIAGVSLDVFESTHAATPTIAGLLIFYTALLLLVLARRNAGIIIGLIGVGGMIIFWHVSGNFARPYLLILQGGDSQEAAYAIIEPSMKSATVINVPSFDAANCISDRLGRSGIREINTLVFTDGRKDFYDGAEFLARRFEIKEIVQLEIASRSYVFNDMIGTLIEKGAAFKSGKSSFDNEAFTYNQGKIKIIRKNTGLSIEYRSKLLHIKALALDNKNGNKVVELVFDGRRQVDCRFVNSSILEMRAYNFGR